MSNTIKKNAGMTRFVNSETGSVAVEAGFILPFMMALWLGLVTMIDMQNASSEVGKVTSTVADILTQAPSTTSLDIDCAFQAGDALLHPDHAGSLQMYVLGVKIEDGENTVEWARGKNLSFAPLPEVGQPYTAFPPELLNSDSFVIIAHGRLSHKPIFGKEFMENETATYDYANFFVPRSSHEIECADCNVNRNTPAQPCV